MALVTADTYLCHSVPGKLTNIGTELKSKQKLFLLQRSDGAYKDNSWIRRLNKKYKKN